MSEALKKLEEATVAARESGKRRDEAMSKLTPILTSLTNTISNLVSSSIKGDERIKAYSTDENGQIRVVSSRRNATMVRNIRLGGKI